MKKALLFLVALGLLSPVFAGGKKGEQATSDEGKPLKVVLVLNGFLGDQSFFDSAARGLDQAEKRYGDKVETRVVETSTDETKWLPPLYDYAEDGSWDIIIAGSWNMKERLAEVAEAFPEQKFILFDESLDYSGGQFANVYSILYRQNESAFLAGALAAKVTSSSMPLSDPNGRTIGFVGGMSLPVINDFLVGYIQGAKYVEPNIKVIVSYVGDFADTPKAKDIALAQYRNQGADVVFNVAGLAGLGVVDAAVQLKKYVLGVDSDQATILGEPSANYILTSALKNVDASLLRAIGLHMEGKLPYGSAEVLGLETGSVGLAENKYYQRLVPDDVRAEISDLATKIQAGEIRVDTSMGKTTAEIDSIIDTVR